MLMPSSPALLQRCFLVSALQFNCDPMYTSCIPCCLHGIIIYHKDIDGSGNMTLIVYLA